jgi:hypothetical protein
MARKMNYLEHPSRNLALCPRRTSRHTPQRAAKGGGHQLAAKDLLTGNSLIVSLPGEREPVAWDLSFGKYVGSGNP